MTSGRRHHPRHHGDHDRGRYARLCGEEVSWLKTSVQGDVFEIRGGRLALQKSSNQAVRTLAQRLITDHTQSLHDALELAHRYHVDVQVEPTSTEQWQLEELGQLTGAAFDHDYAQLEVADHIQDIGKTKDEVEMGCSSKIRHEAATDLPTLREHLRLSRQALATASED